MFGEMFAQISKHVSGKLTRAPNGRKRVAAEKTPGLVFQSQRVVLKCISFSFNSVLRLFVLTQEGVLRNRCIIITRLWRHTSQWKKGAQATCLSVAISERL